MDNPFDFLIKVYTELIENFQEKKNDIEEVYLPLYSYRTKQVEEKSGLNAWNGASKSKGNPIPRPLNEIYIPIPKEFHKKHPDFFTPDILEFEKKQKNYVGPTETKPQVRFHL